MNTGQTMLTVGALALLSIITMRYYASVAQNGQNLVQSNAGLTATTIATSYIERAQSLAFDQNSAGTALNLIQANHNLLSTAAQVLHGTDNAIEEMSPDSLTDFDDFNFYNHNNPIIYHPGNINETYKVEFDVYYVDTSNIDARVNYITFIKKMDIKVYRVDTTSLNAAFDTVRLSTIYGLFRFNN